MGAKSELDAFLTPQSVAVVGATQRPLALPGCSYREFMRSLFAVFLLEEHI